MFPVPWCDVLEIIPTTRYETTLTITGNSVESPVKDNLCFSAWRLVADLYKIPSVNIHLHKVIPTGAGLGGGSSDASFTLGMLNDLFQLNLDFEVLRSLAVQLGMDCPFFIENIPALSTGRGELLEPVSLKLDGYYLVVAKPPIHVSTAAAFAGIRPLFRENSIEDIALLSVTKWRKLLHNDFEETVFDLYPDIQEIKNRMYRQGAVYSAMSGSGSAVFGLFAEKPAQLEFTGCEIFQTLLGSHF